LSPREIVYASGPAYGPEEVESITALTSLLETSGFDPYLPTRDGLPFMTSKAGDDAGHPDRPRALQVAAFALDIFQIVDRCECLLFSMNGRVPDHASTFRAAVAFRAGKPVVLYKRDHRSKLHCNDNAMIIGLSFDFSTVIEPGAVPRRVAEAIREARSFETGSRRQGVTPPPVSIVSELGSEVWESLRRFRDKGLEGEAVLLDELASMCRASEAWRLYS